MDVVASRHYGARRERDNTYSASGDSASGKHESKGMEIDSMQPVRRKLVSAYNYS